MRDASEDMHSKRRLIFFAFILVITADAVAYAANANRGGQIPDNEPRLDLKVRTDRDSYRKGDVVAVEILLVNRSDAPIYVLSPLDWGESASLSIWMKDAVSGKDLEVEFFPDAITPPPSSKDDFVRISPEHVFGVMYRPTLVKLNIKKPGAYELVAKYHSPVPSDMNFGLPIWSRENGVITSSPVRITVVR